MSHQATPRISTTTAQHINDQISKEAHASANYLAMSTWCRFHGYEGAATFLMEHAEEERQHMHKLISYLLEVGIQPSIPDVKDIPQTFQSLPKIFEKAYHHECSITSAIHAIVHHALTIQDYATFGFMQWFIEEQREEEAIFQRALELISIIQEDNLGCYTIDKAIGKLSKQKTAIN